MHKKDLGSLGEVMVMQQALSHGCSVFTECGDNSKVDLIIMDRQDRLHKIQVKVVNRLDNPRVTTLYLYKNGPNGYRVKYKSSDVDWFAVVDLTLKEVAWVPSAVCDSNGSAFTMRHVPPGGRGGPKCNFWGDYTLYPFGEDVTQQFNVCVDVTSSRKGIRERNDPLVEKVLSSGIDFSKMGWVKEVAMLLGKREQKINGWMKKYMPDFYEERCFKRAVNSR